MNAAIRPVANTCHLPENLTQSQMNYRLVAIAFFCFMSMPAFAAEFRAGAAALDISPHMGVSINGNMTDQKGTNIHDPLHTRCLVLDDGKTRLAMVVTDSCLIYREIFDAAKKIVHDRTGFPTENILMSATHCHSAPASVSIFQTDADPAYQKFLTQRLADAVCQAINNLQPAQIGWGSGNEPRHVFNRRWKMKPGIVNRSLMGGTNDQVRMNPKPGGEDLLEPAGPTDPQVSILAVKSLEGKPIALLANYSMHYCGGVPNATFSADYFGAFCERIEQLLNAEHQDPPFVGLMSNGTSGDCNAINFYEPVKPEKPYEKIHTVANDVAEVALKAYQNIQWHDWVPLQSRQKELSLEVRKPSKAEVEKARAQFAKARHVNGQLDNWSTDIYAREAVLLDDYPPRVSIILQTFRIGDLGIAAIPCEVFAETGLQIKKESPVKPVFTIELANGWHGYIPTPTQHALGGYETWRARSSYLETNAAPKIVEGLMELFSQLTP